MTNLSPAAGGGRRAWPALARGAAGVAISVLALALVVGSVDLGAVGHVLGNARPGFLVILVAATCVDLACRTIRWRILVASIKRVAFASMMGYLLVGYLANNLLPARLGELVRSHYLGDREGFSRATALGTVLVERVVDTAVLVAIASVAIVVLHVRGLVANAVLLGVGLTGLLVLGLALATRAHRLPFGDRLIAALGRWPAVARVGARLGGGLAVAERPRTLAWTVGWSLAAWAATIVGFAAAAQAVGVELTISQAVLLGAGVALSTAIPAGPGYVGTFELAGVQIAAVFGVPASSAFALTLLAHGSALLLTSTGGAIALARLGWRPRDPSGLPARLSA